MTAEDSTNPSAESQPGNLLAGRFALLEELGSGSSGTVYRARTLVPLADLPAGTVVAIKFLRQDLLGDEQARAQLAREGRLGLQLRSPHVVRIYAVENIEVLGMNTDYLVMEWVDGQSLRDYLLENGRVLEDFARRIGQDAARGLADLHRLGIVHRDLKPENLLITSEGRVKLMDLGLARRRSGRGRPSSSGFFGSLAYAAPEALRGQRAEAGADLYALGLVLFELVTGEHPFAGQLEVDEMLRAQLEQDPPRPSHLQARCSPFLDQLVGELLAKDPKDRPRSAAEVAQRLELGESSPEWRRHEKNFPVLASRRRLKAMRRWAPTRLFGREAEQRKLDRKLRAMLRGRFRVLQIVGPPGIGRRRLLDECIGRWLDEHQGLRFLGGAAEVRADRLPGTPFPQILQDWLLRGDATDTPRIEARLAARMEELWGWSADEAGRLAAAISGRAQEQRPRVRAELFARGLLAIASSRRALVLRIDADQSLGSTANLVLAQLAGQRDLKLLLLLVTSRDRIREDLPGTVLELEGLRLEEFCQFGIALFRSGEAPQDSLADAHPRLFGSPGSLIESLADLAATDSLQGHAGDYHNLASGTSIQPARPTLQRFRRRLLDLSAATLHCMRAAAVLGEHFQIADLSTLIGRSELEALEDLSRFPDQIIQEGAGRARFRHRAYRLALLDETPDTQRFHLHRKTAQILQERDATPLEIGLHLSRAMEHQACLEPLLQGLARRVAAGSQRAALRIAQRLRLHLGHLPIGRAQLGLRLRYLELAGRANVLAGRQQRAESCFKQANLLAGQFDDRRAKARALLGLGEIAHDQGRLFSALQILGQAENLLAGAWEPEARDLLARLQSLHARVLAFQGQGKEAMILQREALDNLSTGDGEQRAHMLIDLARWESLRAHYSASLRNFATAEKLLVESGSRPGRLRLLIDRGRTLAAIGDEAGTEESAREAEEIAEQLADRRGLARIALLRGELLAFTGDGGEAASQLMMASRLAKAEGDRITQSYAQALLALVEPWNQEDPNEEVAEIPLIQVTWLLARAKRLPAGDAAIELCREISELERSLDLPLLLRITTLRACGRTQAADRLIQGIASRLGSASMRRRFLAFGKRIGV